MEGAQRAWGSATRGEGRVCARAAILRPTSDLKIKPHDRVILFAVASAVRHVEQLQRIGQACEFGLCKGERKSDGKPCGMWVVVSSNQSHSVTTIVI